LEDTPMKGTSLAVLAIAVFVLAFAPSQVSAKDEVVELRSGSRMDGEVVEVTADTVTIKVDNATMKIPMTSIDPYCAYNLRLSRIDPKDAQAHMALGDFCLANGLYSEARHEYRRAVEQDLAQTDAANAKLAELGEKESAWMFEQAGKLTKETKFSDAAKRLEMLLSRYPECKQADDAKKALAALTETIRKQNEERERLLKMLDKKAADDKAAKGEGLLKSKFDEGSAALDAAKTANADGLDNEGATKVSRADKAWKESVDRLVEARDIIAAVLKETKDVDLMTAGKAKLVEIDRWLVIVYCNLGHLWAVEGNFKDAVKWLNKALAIDPTDKVATELKLRVAEQQIRRSAHGSVVTDPLR
jgi:tetratricopeptide (TPR) repeat protein